MTFEVCIFVAMALMIALIIGFIMGMMYARALLAPIPRNGKANADRI